MYSISRTNHPQPPPYLRRGLRGGWGGGNAIVQLRSELRSIIRCTTQFFEKTSVVQEMYGIVIFWNSLRGFCFSEKNRNLELIIQKKANLSFFAFFFEPST
jgi:hypothetical protein